jgi:hypothetical protein
LQRKPGYNFIDKGRDFVPVSPLSEPPQALPRAGHGDYRDRRLPPT